MAESNLATTLVKTSDMSPRERWAMEIDYAERELKKFYERGEFAIRRYIDERDMLTVDAKYFNIFYANTNILESALYAQVPKPAVSRKYTDYKDQNARVAALILERSLEQDLNDPSDTFDATMRQAVQDRLVAGLGTAWLRLETETEDIPESEGGQLTNDSMGTEPGPDAPDEGFKTPAAETDPTFQDPNPVGIDIPLKRIKQQRVAVDYVHWKDLLWSPCRVWSERRWVARKVYLDREQLEKRFGEKGKLCALNYSTAPVANDKYGVPSTPTNEAIQKAIVYEIWDRCERKVVWFSNGSPDILDTRDDFLGLQSFEPCPAPMLANVSTSNTTPRPDYYMIQDQYNELDLVNARISLLVSACKVVGVYNQSAAAIGQLLRGSENTMVPVENWAQFTEKGGTAGNIEWLPLDQVVTALQRLYEAREAIKGQIYELTGIADIVRGASKASETLGAQQIKAQFASVRIKKLQDEVARFAGDILRIKAEIMAKHFEPELLIRKSGITRTDNQEFIAPAVALLQSEEGFEWRISIQSDSMAQADYAMEKADRIEFMSAVSSFMGQALPMTIQMPETKPIIMGLLKWGISGFKKADDIEGMIDKHLSEIEGKPPAPPPPDPKVESEKLKQQTMQQKAQLDAQAQQQDMQIEQQRFQLEQQKTQAELASQERMNQMEMAMKKMEMEFKWMEHQMKMKFGMEEMQMKMAGQQQEQQLNLAGKEQDLALQREQGEQQLELGEQQNEQKLTQSEESHKQSLKQAAAEAKAKPAKKESK